MSTSPSRKENTKRNQDWSDDESRPPCPVCGTEAPTKNGSYWRNPHGAGPVRMQQYECANGDSFSDSLDGVKDGYRYPTIIIRLCLAIYILSDTSLGTIQDIVTITFGERPSRQRINEWVDDAIADPHHHQKSTDFGDLVMNKLPTYSGVYTYDEQYIEIDHGDAYRLTLYDSLMQAPVAEQVVSSLKGEVITEFLTTALADKPIYAVTTDGRSDYADIVEDDLGELVAEECGVAHYRCVFHFLRNITDALSRELESARHSKQRKVRMAVVTSEFKQALRAQSYPAAVRRFDQLIQKAKLEPLPPKVEGYVQDVMEQFDTYVGHLRDEWLPSTTNDCEQYYSNTQSARRLRRLQNLERINGVLWQQQRIRTIKEGLISREASTELAQEMFPGISPDAVEQLFVKSKQRYLRGRDLEVS
jgi:hypothetical protein